MLPWWASLYLSILGLLTLAGIIEELKKPGGQIYAMGTFVTFVFIFTFVFGFFNAEVSSIIGLFSLPMLVLALTYDFYLSGLDLTFGSKNFMKPDVDVKSRMDLLTATMIVTPGYLAGLVISYRAIVNL